MTQEVIKPGTPLPWQYRDDYTSEGFVTIIGNVDGEYIDGQAVCTYDVICRCEDEFGERLPNVAQNVRYIVHCANSYPTMQATIDELVAGLELVANRLQWAAVCAIVTGDERMKCNLNDWTDEARALIAKHKAPA